MRGDEVAERVAAELLARRARELEGDRGLGDDRERRDRATSCARRAPAPARACRGRPSAAASSASAAASSRRARRAARRSSCRPRCRRRGSSRAAPARTRSRRAPRSRAAARARSRRRSRRPSWPGCPPPRRPAARRGGPARRTSRARAARRGADLDDAAERVAVGARLVDPRRGGAASSTAAPATAIAEQRQQRLRDAPAATRAAVSRADARSSTLRTSSRSYFSDAREVGVARPRQRHRLRALPCGSSSGGHALIPHSSSRGRGCAR